MFSVSIYAGAICWLGVLFSTETVPSGYCRDFWNTFDEVIALMFLAWLAAATVVFIP